MILFKKAAALSKYILEQKQRNKEIGFVPTMGALHGGHLSLIAASQKRGSLTVCSIFVNPTQFNNPDDFKHYPVTVEKDIQLLLTAGCDVLFLPDVGEIYPAGYTPERYDLGLLETVLEGRFRPGHFQGVCQVVDRLLHIMRPSVLYLGQKDYQQCMVIQALVNSQYKEAGIEIITVPTLREEDGLAMSSRNLRLTGEQRERAPLLYRALLTAKKELPVHTVDEVRQMALGFLTANGFNVDYFEIADALTLQPPGDKTDKLIALVAASLGNVRLIDNMILN